MDPGELSKLQVDPMNYKVNTSVQLLAKCHIDSTSIT